MFRRRYFGVGAARRLHQHVREAVEAGLQRSCELREEGRCAQYQPTSTQPAHTLFWHLRVQCRYQ
eukprot:COSAG01_NODE_258_length_20077_cov_124.162429_9_plen_65_part_00